MDRSVYNHNYELFHLSNRARTEEMRSDITYPFWVLSLAVVLLVPLTLSQLQKIIVTKDQESLVIHGKYSNNYEANENDENVCVHLEQRIVELEEMLANVIAVAESKVAVAEAKAAAEVRDRMNAEEATAAANAEVKSLQSQHFEQRIVELEEMVANVTTVAESKVADAEAKAAAEVRDRMNAEEATAAANAEVKSLQSQLGSLHSDGWNPGVDSAQICELDGSILNQTDSMCYKMLYPHLGSKPAWHFMGDSQMGYLFEQIEKIREFQDPDCKTVTKKARKRCGFLEYANLEKRDVWIPPNATQGPHENGFTHHFCSDLTIFRNIIHYSDRSIDESDGSIDGNGKKFFEFLVVEFASDVEQQTPETNTTQETLSKYLQNQLNNYKMVADDSVCVVNTGMHDQKLCIGELSEENACVSMYITNVERYLELLDPVCGNILWVGTTHVRGDLSRPQKNSLIILFNEAVKELISEKIAWKQQPKYFFLDIWNVSSTSEHKDNVHFQPLYYKIVGKLLTSLM